MRLPATLRPNRSELIGSAFLTIAMLAIGGGVASSASIGPWLGGFPALCLDPERASATDCARFAIRIDEYWNAVSNVAGPAVGITVALPILVAVVLGLSLMARELEQQTTLFAWSIAPSRRRWLLARVFPALVLVTVVCLAAGVLADATFALRTNMDPWRSLDGLGVRGPAVAGIGVLAFGSTLGLGSILGRQLPAMLAALALTASAGVLASDINDRWLDSDSVVGPMEQTQGARVLDPLLMTADGEVIGWDEAERRYGSAIYQTDPAQLGLTQVYRYIPGDRYPVAVARLTGLFSFAGLVGIALTFVVVNRRRPY
jgi:hypothetical protein